MGGEGNVCMDVCHIDGQPPAVCVCVCVCVVHVYAARKSQQQARTDLTWKAKSDEWNISAIYKPRLQSFINRSDGKTFIETATISITNLPGKRGHARDIAFSSDH